LCHREAASGTASCAKMSHRISCAEMDGAAILDRTVNRAFSRSRVVDGERRHHGASRFPTPLRAAWSAPESLLSTQCALEVTP
jgi:hypothetical protein